MQIQNEKQMYKNSQNSYEEINEKKTSVLGYILLIIMVIFVIGVGETIFSDLKEIPKKPTRPSSCIQNSITNLEALTNVNCPNYNNGFDRYSYDLDKYDNNTNTFNEIDAKFGIDTQFNAIKSELQEIASLNETINSHKRKIRNLENNIQELNKNYDLGLQEKMANEDPIMDTPGTRGQITNSRSQINTLESDISSSENKRSSIISQISPSIKSLERSYEEAFDHYLTNNAWYKFKIFLLTLVFVLPFFSLSVYFYLKLKRKDSPYTIILTALTTAFSILFLQVIGVFLYDMLPKEWLGRIFKFFLEIPLLRYIIYYGSVLLIIGIFGGIVYYIQKKVFDPVKVAIRRLKDKKCPGCSFTLDTHHNFCPHCGLQLKEKCENCENVKIKYLAHCPNCGKE